MPSSGTNCGKQQKLTVVHPCQSCWDGDKMTNDRNKPPCKGGSNAMVIKISLTLLHFLLIQKAHLSPFAVGKLINDRSADVECYKVVDAGAYIGT